MNLIILNLDIEVSFKSVAHPHIKYVMHGSPSNLRISMSPIYSLTAGQVKIVRKQEDY